jgi:putative transcriptional regulator
MDAKNFAKLLKGVTEAGEIARGERAPARETVVDAAMVKELRAELGLSQSQFASLLTVELSTLRNWEQGRREPQGPARALLRAIRHSPKAVMKALQAA